MRQTRTSGLTREEAIGLGVAIAAHIALIAVLTLEPLGRKVQPPPQRMTVSFAPTIADQSVSPKPDAQPAPDSGDNLGAPPEQPQPVVTPAPQPEPKPVPEPKPEPKPKPAPPKPEPKPKPAPKPEPKPEPKPVAKPKPEPKAEKAPAKPAEKPKPAPKAEAKPKSEAKSEAKPEAKEKADTKAKGKAEAKPTGAAATHPKTDQPAGHSRIGKDFLAGIAGVTSPGTDKVSPGDKAGAVPVAALVSAISRQIKPHWSAPQGVDTDQIVTVLAWSLNPDGSLAGRPTVVSQSGINDANRAQAQRHAELAIRAVQLAAPFTLPPQAYAQWHRVASFRFDRKLSQ
jgi:outer membrane biosynthesis protein TonB